MKKTSRLVLVVLVVVMLIGGGWLAFSGGTDAPRAKKPATEPETVELDTPDVTSRPEPRTTRVHVDNSGQTISVAVRTPKKPWSESLAVEVNGARTTLQRDKSPVTGRCAAKVVAEPTSLLTRLDFRRSCVKEPESLRVSVSVDEEEPILTKAAQADRPNVLMIMVDDMRFDELKWMPNVQKLITAQGVNFVNGFSSFPLCCPARSSVVTGQYPHNHGVWSHEPPWGFSSLDDSSTFPVWLRAEGYRTTYLGKYLNGYGVRPEPGRQSGTSTQYVPPGWSLWQASIDGGLAPSDPNDGGTYRYWDTTLNNNGNGYVNLAGRYQTDAYAEITEDVIAESAAADGPWLSYVSFTAPHHGGPIESDDPPDVPTPARPKRLRGSFNDLIKQAPGADWHDPDNSDKPKKTQGKPSKALMKQVRDLARQRAEALYVVDGAVKRIIGKLKETGELKNTTVVFTSDNGFFLGEQGIPAGKILPYEPSLRVPLVMRGPGIPKGEVRTDPFLSIDYAPTFADLGDAPVTASVDGRSLLDVARLGDESTGDSWSRVVLTEKTPTGAATAAVAKRQPVGARSKKMMLGKVTGIRTGQYLYTEWQPEPGDPKTNIRRELYDVLVDPNQYDNLAVSAPDKDLLKQFHRVLKQARTCVGAECRVLLPPDLRG